MTDPRLSIEDIRRELSQTAETLAEASDSLERLSNDLWGGSWAPIDDFPDDHEYWPETEE